MSDSELVAALKRDLSLTGDQVRARLKKERWAAGATERLRRALGDGFAGAWLTEKADALMVAVTDPSLAETVWAEGAEVRIVAHSAKALNSVKGDLDRRAARVQPDVAGWYVDLAANTVVVLAHPSARAGAQRWAQAGGAPAGAVRVIDSNLQPVPLADVRGGEAYFINNRARCSIGFSVEGGFVTAGHCGGVGSTTSGVDQASGRTIAQGTVRASSFPGDDFGFVEVNDDWTPKPVVNTTDNGELPVAGSREAPVGASICRTGSTTGTRCGVIEAKNVTVNYAEGTVPGLTQTDVCAEGGDSGGSWLSNDQAQGVTSGGSGNCTSGGTTFFQPVNEILQRLNLTLVTTGDGGEGGGNPPPAPPAPPAPPPAPPAPSDCNADPQRTFRGSLSGTGARQTQPNGRFFRATAGRHVGCLDGPAGADFDLFLQRWNGRAFQTVARATGSSSDERITFNGRAGFYRYRVVSDRGSGSYTLSF